MGQVSTMGAGEANAENGVWTACPAWRREAEKGKEQSRRDRESSRASLLPQHWATAVSWLTESSPSHSEEMKGKFEGSLASGLETVLVSQKP